MIWGFGRRAAPALDAMPLYGALVRITREPAFYAIGGVPDTFEGRFDLLLLHLVLVLHRLAAIPDGDPLAQTVTDTLFAQLDDTLREMGVSDFGVPKRMKRLAEAYRGRSAAYLAALTEPDDAALATALARNLLGRSAIDASAQALARYVQAAVARLEIRSLQAIQAGADLFPAPQTILAGDAA